MKILANHKYKIEIENLVSQNRLTSLMLLYQPIIGHEAIGLYLTLAAESRHNKALSEVSRLLSITNSNIITLQNAIDRLLEFNLLEVYADETEENYLFHIVPALDTEEFFRHKIYSRLLLKYQGSDNYEITLSRLKKSYHKKENMKKMEKNLEANIFNDWDEIKELEYDQIKKVQPVQNLRNQYNNNFDYKKFLQLATTTTLPYEIRTNENMNRIGELACVYGISPSRMLVHVGHSINLSKNILNINRLAQLVSTDKKTDVKFNKNNPYDSPCIVFLQNKLGGIPVIDYHKRILNNLVENIKLKPEVVNILIEFIMNNSDNKLPKNYIETTAVIWKQNNIDTIEKAKDFIDGNKKTKAKRKSYKSKPAEKTLPAYKKGEKTKGDIKVEISDDEAAELLKQLKKKG